MSLILLLKRLEEEEWKGMKYLKKPVKYLIHVKTNQGKTVNSGGTKKIAEKEKLKDHKLKDKNIL